MLLVLLMGMPGNDTADPTTLLVVHTLGLGMELPLQPMAFPSVSSLLVVPGTLGQLQLLILVHQLVFPLWDLDLGLPSRSIGYLTVYWHSLAGGALSIYEGPSMRYAYSLITNGPTSSFVLPCHLGDQGRHALSSFKATGIMPMRQRSITPRLDTPIELRHNISHAPFEYLSLSLSYLTIYIYLYRRPLPSKPQGKRPYLPYEVLNFTS